MSKEWTPESVLDVLGCPIARDILALTSKVPISAAEIVEHCEVSPPTVYRRIAALESKDLIDHRTRIGNDGHHYKEFFTDLECLTITIDGGGLEAECIRPTDYTDKFATFWQELGIESMGLSDTPFPSRRDMLSIPRDVKNDG